MIPGILQLQTEQLGWGVGGFWTANAFQCDFKPLQEMQLIPQHTGLVLVGWYWLVGFGWLVEQNNKTKQNYKWLLETHVFI